MLSILSYLRTVYSEPDRTTQSRRAPEERGPFGRSTRRRGHSRSRTGTTPAAASKDELAASENLKVIDDIFNSLKKTDADKAKAAIPPTPSNAPTNLSPEALKDGEPTECLLYGFGADFQYSAIEFFERISLGTIYEDYDRHPSNGRFNLALSHSRATAQRTLSSAILQKVNTYQGGDHWIKVTFDSPEAAERASAASPHVLNGFLVYCERYRNIEPAIGDRAIPANEQRSLNLADSPSSSRTLPRAITDSPSSATASSATATHTVATSIAQPEMSELTQRRVPGAMQFSSEPANVSSQQQQQTAAARQAALKFGATRAVLLPAEQALLPAPSKWQALVRYIPGISWAYGNAGGIRVSVLFQAEIYSSAF